jgi:hypothetical protein
LKSTNKTGFSGVHWDTRQNKWRACVRLNGKTIHLGCFEDVLDAGVAACDFRLKHEAEIAAAHERGNCGRSKRVKEHKARLSTEEKREIARKGHAKRNGRVSKANRSGYLGVSWDSRRERWYVIVRNTSGKKVRLGSYLDLDEAGIVAEAYRQEHGLAHAA